MEAVYRLIDAVSQNKSTVLLSGESGTGKELVARTIHQRGILRDAPFVAINCAGLSETLLDSQLFGHRRGAFTGAVADHDGVFRAATGGTLLLDEVAEVPLGLQAKFLRAIQEREVTPLGSSRPVAVDVRLIAATNRDLEAEVRDGRFRADLFYRLNVVHIELPPLRARREDIPPLVEHFLAQYSEQYQVAPKRIAPDALEALVAFDWPGNIRQLQNTIERAFALSAADVVSLADLPPALRGGPAPEVAPRCQRRRCRRSPTRSASSSPPRSRRAAATRTRPHACSASTASACTGRSRSITCSATVAAHRALQVMAESAMVSRTPSSTTGCRVVRTCRPDCRRARDRRHACRCGSPSASSASPPGAR